MAARTKTWHRVRFSADVIRSAVSPYVKVLEDTVEGAPKNNVGYTQRTMKVRVGDVETNFASLDEFLAAIRDPELRKARLFLGRFIADYMEPHSMTVLLNLGKRPRSKVTVDVPDAQLLERV